MISKNKIKSVVFLGSGNVATHLSLNMQKKGLQILQIYSPTAAHAKSLALKLNSAATSNLTALEPHADLYLICISDDQINLIAKQLPEISGIVAHTSGIIGLKALGNFHHYGVFYPLQTFSKNRPINLNRVPFCIEGNDESSRKKLFNLAKSLSHSIYFINSEDRKQIHLAAVFVNNFSNHLYAVAEKFLKEKNLDFELLLPLMNETTAKLNQMKPGEAQTGPARRNDQNTLKIHSEMLENNPGLLEIYQLFSYQILQKYYEQL